MIPSRTAISWLTEGVRTGEGLAAKPPPGQHWPVADHAESIRSREVRAREPFYPDMGGSRDARVFVPRHIHATSASLAALQIDAAFLQRPTVEPYWLDGDNVGAAHKSGPVGTLPGRCAVRDISFRRSMLMLDQPDDHCVESEDFAPY